MNIYLYYLKKYFAKGKKLLLVSLTIIMVVYSFIYFLNKDKVALNLDKNTDVVRNQIYQTINDKKLNSTKEGKLSILLYRSLNCSLIGEACTNNPHDGNKNIHNSLAGLIGKMFTFQYSNPPASGIYWVADSLQKSGLIPNTYATEGIGFASIRAFQPIWKIFRDISLLFIVLFLIISGFMIMLRTKINPQTVISIENSLPRIVITLLFIVFSFAIAGFLIDLMYISTIIIVSQFSSLNIGDFFNTQNKTELINKFVNPGLWEIYPRVDSKMTFYGIGNAFYNILPLMIQEFLKGPVTVITSIGLTKFMAWFWQALPDGFTNLSGGGGASIFGTGIQGQGGIGNLAKIPAFYISLVMIGLFSPYIVSFLISLVIFLSVFTTIVRIFIILLKTYVKIVLLIIFSPLILLLGAWPGKNFIFSWIKNLSVNLFIFPIVTTLVLVSAVIAKINLDETLNVWVPPYIYGLDPQAITALIGFGIMLVIPDIIKLIKESVGLKDSGISPHFFGAATAIGAGGMGAFNKYLSTRYYAQSLPPRLKAIVEKWTGGKSEAPPAKPVNTNV